MSSVCVCIFWYRTIEQSEEKGCQKQKDAWKTSFWLFLLLFQALNNIGACK